MHHLVGLKVTLRAPRGLLGEIPTEVCDVGKMKSRFAGSAVRVMEEDILSASHPLGLGILRYFFVLRRHGLLPQFCKPQWLTFPVSAGPFPF